MKGATDESEEDLQSDEIIARLQKHSEEDIYFAKPEWREWIKKREFDKFLRIKGANIQEIYKIFQKDKILYVRPAKKGRLAVRVKHSSNYDVEVFLKFDKPEKGMIEVYTYVKESKQRRRKQFFQ